MKILVLIAALAAAAAGLSCRESATEPPAATPPAATPPADPSTASVAGTKQAWIYFTKNHNKGMGSPYNTDCVGIVGTERIGARMGKMATSTSPPEPGTKIMWHVRMNNGGNDDDKCEMLDVTQVNLRFNTDVMGAAAMKKLTANAGGVIDGEVSSDPMDIGSVIDHKYRVYIGNDIAGPDPIVVVGCGGCGL
jgi:hypothetical protein